MPQLSWPKKPYGLPQVVLPISRTSTSTPRKPLTIAPLAEQVLPLTSTATRDRFSVGRASLLVQLKVVGFGTQARFSNKVVEPSLLRLLLNCVLSNAVEASAGRLVPPA